jgi:hypothetical protein
MAHPKRSKQKKTKHGLHLSAQCLMRSTDTDGKGENLTHTVPPEGEAYYEGVVWIPAKLGKKGSWVKIDGYSGNWQVIEVRSKRPE